jgi:DNA-directed RNA polymerase sigma subunit (sigma70/sigma32)
VISFGRRPPGRNLRIGSLPSASERIVTTTPLRSRDTELTREALDRILRAHASLEQLEARVRAARADYRTAIQDAVEAGGTMSEIGRLLGVTRQRVAQILAEAREQR